MIKNLSLLAVAVFGFSAARAALLVSAPAESSLNGVRLARGGVLATSDGVIPLTEVGAALRSKKVVLLNFKVYIGELFVSDAATFSATAAGALSSLAGEKAVAIRLHFLRDVDAEKVVEGFKEALEANGVDLKSAALQSFFSAVVKGGEAKESKTLTIAGEKSGATEKIFYEDGQGALTSIEGPPGLIRSIFSIWFGKSADSGLESFKKELLKR
jgi:hypothetical protein